jgi:uncharacterized protein with PIN domain
MNGREQSLYETEDGIIFWLKSDGSIGRAWTERGTRSYPVTLLAGKTPEEAAEFIRLNPNVCSKCGKPMEKPALTHLSGEFCESCAAEYKKRNSGICRLCRQPYWRCTC